MIHYTLFVFMMAMMLLVILVGGWSWVVDFSIMAGTLTLSLSFFVETQSSAFMMSVLIIFAMVYLYSFSYLAEEIYLKRFLAILSLFVSSMCILILSSNLFSSLIGWDGLGVTSLFLILFYYSKSALKAGTLTFLMNRVGDCFFILGLTQIILMGENQICYSPTPLPYGIALLLVLTSITKSAQIPFSTWLPAAMEAPTPVSALVHSSTLVTAGIYLLYRYSTIWMDTNLKTLLMILSVSTCFMAGLSALVESDLKKLIALSTLSQLGFIMFSFSLGLMAAGFLHMLMHAYFKALLFMCAGLVIHSFKGSQSIMELSLSKSQSPLLMVVMSCSFLSMSGMPFLSGFYSKDLIIDSLKMSEWSVLVYLLLVGSFLLTIMYSVRAIWYLSNSSNGWHSMIGSDMSMVKPMLPLSLLASIGGSSVSWLMVEGDLYVESSKLSVLTLLSVTSVLYWCQQEIKTSFFLEKKWNLSIMNPLLSEMLFHGAKVYKCSSDLLGIPEVMNSQIKAGLKVGGALLARGMVHYSGNLEFILFLFVLIMLV